MMSTAVLNLPALSAGAFLLGSCPCSVWVGRILLHTDIRRQGDGNPGATNVFRAGSVPAGVLAVVLDIGKGIPFVVLARTVLGLGAMESVCIGLAAILGHAFSPFLGFKGGKALAPTAGVIIALADAPLFWSFFFSALLFFAILEDRPWLVVLTPVASLVYLLLSGDSGWYALFMLGVATLFIFKQAPDIHGAPRLKPRLTSIFQFRRPV